MLEDDDGLPYFPLWVAKYDSRTAHLTLEQDGAYMRLLRLCWKTPGCTIPHEAAWVTRHMRVTTAEFGAVVAPILAEFFTASEGRWVNRTLLKVWREQLERHRRLSDAGKRGAKAKALKNGQTTSSPALASHSHSHSHSKSSFGGRLLTIVLDAIGPAFPDPDEDEITRTCEGWIEDGLDIETDVVPVVRARTAKRGSRPIRFLAYLDKAVREHHATRSTDLFATRPPKPQKTAPAITIPEGKAGAALRAIIEAKGQASAAAWFSGVEWNGTEVYVQDDHTAARIRNDFGAILREHGYSVAINPSPKSDR